MKHRNIVDKKYKYYLSLKNQLQEPDVLSNPHEYATISKKLKEVEELGNGYTEYLSLEKELVGLEDLLKIEQEHEMKELLKSEHNEKKHKLEKLGDQIPYLLAKEDEEDKKPCFVEIQGKAGGDEANIFVGNMFDMYSRYFSEIDWKVKILDESRSDNGGFSRILFSIEQKGAYGVMRGENGIHRVQRVPSTESKGRVHTSTVKVIVSPVVDRKEINIRKDDLEIATFRASGAGGQHVNKTDSAVRIKHVPSGIVVASQAGRSQHDNKEHAMNALASMLKERELEKERAEKKAFYQSAGDGERAEKIRTYNYPQNRVTDHRVEYSWLKLDRIMYGDIGEIIGSVKSWREAQKLEQILNEEN